MAIDIETKREVIELYFNQHKNIREVAKLVQKSSRDVVAVVKEHKQKLRPSESSIHVEDKINQQIEDSVDPPANIKAYELFTKGLTPLQGALELKLSEVDTTRYYAEYIRLK